MDLKRHGVDVKPAPAARIADEKAQLIEAVEDALDGNASLWNERHMVLDEIPHEAWTSDW
jgi:phenylpyruvate tautomerase PptA (4-oxalocrotonate tautomerase family)